jgi:hypothetical protein
METVLEGLQAAARLALLSHIFALLCICTTDSLPLDSHFSEYERQQLFSDIAVASQSKGSNLLYFLLSSSFKFLSLFFSLSESSSKYANADLHFANQSDLKLPNP